MLTQPEDNIILDDNQKKAIEETKSRLFNLESEISIATKTLRGLKSENERLIKDNSYQNELLLETISKVDPMLAKVADLESNILTKTEELNKINVEIQTKATDIEEREAEIKTKENNIEDRLKSVTEKEGNIRDINGILNQKIDDFNQKVSKLKEVIATI